MRWRVSCYAYLPNQFLGRFCKFQVTFSKLMHWLIGVSEIASGPPSVKGRPRRAHRVTSHPRHPNPQTPSLGPTALPAQAKPGCWDVGGSNSPRNSPRDVETFLVFNFTLELQWHRNSCVCWGFFLSWKFSLQGRTNEGATAVHATPAAKTAPPFSLASIFRWWVLCYPAQQALGGPKK